MRRITTLLTAVTLSMATLLSLGATAAAQDPVEVDGSADFRNPPTLAPGQYRDTIVTGEAVWYALIYTDNTPYRFEVTLPEVDLEAQEELTLETRFITPTLGDVDSGSTLVEGAGASITGGGTQTFKWYLEIALSTTGRLGVEYDLLLDIQGVQRGSLLLCSEVPECTLDLELAALDEELAALQADLAELQGVDSTEVLEADIAALEAEIAATEEAIEDANQRAQAARASEQEAADEIAEICSPDADCDVPPEPSSSMPIWALVLAILVLVGGVGMLGMQLRSRA